MASPDGGKKVGGAEYKIPFIELEIPLMDKEY